MSSHGPSSRDLNFLNADNKIKMSSFKSPLENIKKKEGGPDRSVSGIQFSSVTLNELAMNARKTYCNFEFQQRSHTMKWGPNI